MQLPRACLASGSIDAGSSGYDTIAGTFWVTQVWTFWVWVWRFSASAVYLRV